MMNQNKNFFEKLFDLSFSSFIAPQIVGILYALGLGAGVLWVLLPSFWTLGSGTGLLSLLGSLLGLLIYAIFLRVALESFVAVIRIAENTRILAEDVLNNTSDRRSQP